MRLWRRNLVQSLAPPARSSPSNEVYVSLIRQGLPESHLPIAEEADRIHESALYSAQGQFEQAKLWRMINLLLGVPGAALAAPPTQFTTPT